MFVPFLPLWIICITGNIVGGAVQDIIKFVGPYLLIAPGSFWVVEDCMGSCLLLTDFFLVLWVTAFSFSWPVISFYSSGEYFLLFTLAWMHFWQQFFFCKNPNRSCSSAPPSPIGQISGEITLPQIHIRHKHFPKDYAPDKSLHFSTWFITEYIVCLHMQEQITSDLYFHNDYCSDSFTLCYIGVRANHLYKKGERSRNGWQYKVTQKGKEGKKKAGQTWIFAMTWGML